MSLTSRDRKIVMILVPLALALAYWFVILAPKQSEADKVSKQLTSAQTKRDAAEQQVNQLNAAKASFAGDYATVIRLGKAIPTSVDMPALIVQLNDAAKGTGVQIQDFKPGTASGGSGGSTPSSAPAPSGAKPGATGSAPGGGGNPAAPGSAPAQSWPGKQAQKAGNAVTTANNQSQGAANATANGPGSTGAAGAAAGGSSASTPGLTQVPLTFTLKGGFFSLADFFHRLKRFVRVVNNQIEVRGRLLTIDSFAFQQAQGGSPTQLQASVNATVYLTPPDQGLAAGATPQGPTSPGGAPASTPATGTSTSPATPTAAATP